MSYTMPFEPSLNPPTPAYDTDHLCDNDACDLFTVAQSRNGKMFAEPFYPIDAWTRLCAACLLEDMLRALEEACAHHPEDSVEWKALDRFYRRLDGKTEYPSGLDLLVLHLGERPVTWTKKQAVQRLGQPMGNYPGALLAMMGMLESSQLNLPDRDILLPVLVMRAVKLTDGQLGM